VNPEILKKAAFPRVRSAVSASLLLSFVGPLRGEAALRRARWAASCEVPAARTSALETSVGQRGSSSGQRQTTPGAGNQVAVPG